MYNNLTVDIQNHIAVVKMNRPKALNALNSETLSELSACMDELTTNEDVYVIVFTGEGKAFVAGADISEMSQLTAEQGRAFGRLGQQVFLKIERSVKPTIAAVNGFALGGGCELSMACDLRIAGRAAKFGQPEVGLGITPGFAGTQRLPQLVGVAKAKELIFTGNLVGAEEAMNIGLVNKVVDDEVLLSEVQALAEKIASNGQLAVRYAKAAIDAGVALPIESGNFIEESYFGLCFATEDQKGAMQAFMNKEKYAFQNK